METLHIRDDAELGRLVERIAGAGRLALDTEFLRERTYFPKLCLVQLATADLLAAIDPLTCRDLGPLWRLLLDGREVVLHASSQDLEIVQRLAGDLPGRVFDTQIAAAFLGLGDSIGYARMVEILVGEAPRRSEAYTDWTERPLRPEQLEYALDDVRYLLACADTLDERLEKRGRREWVREELEAVTAAVCHSPEPTQQWSRVSGARGLPARALVVLREVAAWREREAVRRDEPRQRLVPDRVLLEIARRAPRNETQVRRLRGLHPREADRSMGDILEAVARGLAVPEADWPSFPALPPRVDATGVEAVASLLDAALRDRASELELASRLVGTRSDLELLVRLELGGSIEEHGAAALPMLRGWRRTVAGDDLLALLRGETALRVQRGPEGVSLAREPRTQ